MKATRECSIDNCPNPVQARGWCKKHYLRWHRHGDPNYVERIVGDHEARFWSKIDKGAPVPGYAPHLGSCWLWTGGKDYKDYGIFQLDGASVHAHRFAYELLVGPIPDGLVIDHLCRVHPCVNPRHLEAVTEYTNTMRGFGACAKNAAKEKCSRGHDFDEENTYYYRDGRRDCRKCMYIRDRERRRRDRERRAAA